MKGVWVESACFGVWSMGQHTHMGVLWLPERLMNTNDMTARKVKQVEPLAMNIPMNIIASLLVL